MEIATITSTMTSAVGALKEIVSLAKNVGNRELNERVRELQNLILNLQTQLIELSTENQGLKERISELKRADEIGRELVYEKSVYWRVGNSREGPFCSVCWDGERKLIHLTPGASKGTFGCGICKGSFTTPA